jgi:hypothetical protein
VLAVGLVLSGCSVFGGGKSAPAKESVFAVRVGQCFKAPTGVHAELSTLEGTPCDKPHAQEAYAIVNYTDLGNATNAPNISNPPNPTSVTNYPGSDLLTKFADSKCAQLFGAYVGVDYLDSSIFFTYLLPSPRSWEQGLDRRVICFITSSGSLRTTSAKGSKQ